MMDSGIPPTQPGAGPQGPNEHNDVLPPQDNAFAKMFPTATPDEVKKIVGNFINFTIQQMKQDQQNMLEALKQMQEDQDQ